jgi:hypothetical protein
MNPIGRHGEDLENDQGLLKFNKFKSCSRAESTTHVSSFPTILTATLGLHSALSTLVRDELLKATSDSVIP